MRRKVPFVVVIPARYASTRLPGKPLLDIAGKPMVVHVAQRARASGASAVHVATDHPEIMAACQAHGIAAIMTRGDHPSGTDRIAEVARKLKLGGDAIVVNVQGDEPLIAPSLIRAVAELLHKDKLAAVATACCPVRDAEEMFNPNAVKVVLARDGSALYFSRAAIPWDRATFGQDRIPRKLPPRLACHRHIGIYAYRASFLSCYASLKPSPLEQAEALEQLRVLWHGYRIAVAVRKDAPVAGVDTIEDLKRVRAVLGASSTAKIDRSRKAR